mmetsp:Transcript_8613/g.9320  ORF Transcript_8613/g.9320 Transcript_8613/m.9320 type:complete len:100 (-) Transcript_8613:173-472(-)
MSANFCYHIGGLKGDKKFETAVALGKEASKLFEPSIKVSNSEIKDPEAWDKIREACNEEFDASLSENLLVIEGCTKKKRLLGGPKDFAREMDNIMNGRY